MSLIYLIIPPLGHLDCSPLVAIINDTTMNAHVPKPLGVSLIIHQCLLQAGEPPVDPVGMFAGYTLPYRSFMCTAGSLEGFTHWHFHTEDADTPF